MISPGQNGNASDFDFLFGTPIPYLGKVAPTNWLLCDGAAVSRTTYASLFNVIAPSIGTFTVTIASPGVFTLTSHGLVASDPVYLTTTGALPTGLSANTIYYVIATGLTANTFQLSTTRGGSAINTTGSQSGTHTLRYCPWGLGDGSTTFNVPNLKGKVTVGRDSADVNFDALNVPTTYVGEKTHTLTTPEIPSHTHDTTYSFGGGSNPSVGGNGTPVTTAASAATGGGGAHNNIQPYVVTNYIIRGI